MLPYAAFAETDSFHIVVRTIGNLARDIDNPVDVGHSPIGKDLPHTAISFGIFADLVHAAIAASEHGPTPEDPDDSAIFDTYQFILSDHFDGAAYDPCSRYEDVSAELLRFRQAGVFDDWHTNAANRFGYQIARSIGQRNRPPANTIEPIIVFAVRALHRMPLAQIDTEDHQPNEQSRRISQYLDGLCALLYWMENGFETDRPHRSMEVGHITMIVTSLIKSWHPGTTDIAALKSAITWLQKRPRFIDASAFDEETILHTAVNAPFNALIRTVFRHVRKAPNFALPTYHDLLKTARAINSSMIS